jgi:CRP/FNR family transcriptional regulator, cyclic AMP receptor protein
MTDAMLALTTGLPERSLAAGEVVYRAGDPVTTVLVLVDGQLQIERGGMVVNSHGVPGSVVGELGALLHQPRSATVTAALPSVVREIGDPDEFFAAHPQVGLEVARQLAGRLYRLTAYVADVQQQFGDRDDHLGVFGELLHRIADRPPIDIEPGSDRSPDY